MATQVTTVPSGKLKSLGRGRSSAVSSFAMQASARCFRRSTSVRAIPVCGVIHQAVNPSPRSSFSQRNMDPSLRRAERQAGHSGLPSEIFPQAQQTAPSGQTRSRIKPRTAGQLAPSGAKKGFRFILRLPHPTDAGPGRYTAGLRGCFPPSGG